MQAELGAPMAAPRRKAGGRHGDQIAPIVLCSIDAGVAFIMLVLSKSMASNAVEMGARTHYLLVQAAAGMVLGVAGAVYRPVRYVCLILSSAAVALLIVTWRYVDVTFAPWDDASGLGWAFLGCACLGSFLLGVGTGITGIVLGAIALVRR